MCVDSNEVEVSEDKTQIRRRENAPLPELNTERKRDAKAAGKAKAPEEPEEDQVDANGRVVLVEKDFDNPLIVQFDVEIAEGEEFKVNWKEIELAVRDTYPMLKMTYARGDDHGGQLALSNLRMKQELLDQLLGAKMTIKEKEYKFSKLEGEPLKEFW